MDPGHDAAVGGDDREGCGKSQHIQGIPTVCNSKCRQPFEHYDVISGSMFFTDTEYIEDGKYICPYCDSDTVRYIYSNLHDYAMHQLSSGHQYCMQKRLQYL